MSHECKRRKMDTQMAEDTNVSASGSSQNSLSSERPVNYRVVLARKGYLVHETLGSGSYSKVKRAVSMYQHQNVVAVKIVDRQRAPKDYQERFLPRELEIWPRLKHPNLLQLVEVFHDGRRVFMVTDYAPNGDVLKFIQDQGAVTEECAGKWMAQICDAVKYMHNQNIAHRDLKLENLLLDAQLNVKVADFGFVRQDAGISLSSTYCGSKSYAAPEILIGRPYNPKRSDIWALGVILYIIVTGRMPFDESKGTRHVLREQERLKLYWPQKISFSESLQKFVVDMFTWSYEKRPDIEGVMKDRWMKNFIKNINNGDTGDSSFQMQPRHDYSITF